MALQKTDKIWHNGKLIRWEDATIHVMSHVVHYGSSVFEGIRCYVPSSGPAIFRADDHIQRLLDSAKVYRMDLPFSREELISAMVVVIKANNIWPCYIRPIVFRGYGDAGVSRITARWRLILSTIPGGNISRRMTPAWTFAFPHGPALRPTRFLRWPSQARIT